MKTILTNFLLYQILTTMSSESQSLNRTKKPKGKCVPSRFKQAAENYSSQSSEGNFSIVGKTRLQDYGQNSSKMPDSWNKTERNETLYEKKTSTPTKTGADLPTFNPSISSSSRLFSETKKNEKVLLPCTTIKKIPPKKSAKKQLSFPSGKKVPVQASKASRDLESEMDIYYAEYQLALLLQNKAQRSLHMRSKTAMEKIGEALSYIKVLLEKQKFLQTELNCVTFAIKFRKHLQKQEKIYQSLLESLPPLEKQYEEIAIAVDNVRHKLLMEDCISFEKGCEGDIIKIIEQINLLLDKIKIVAQSPENISLACESVNTYASKTKIAVEEIKRASDILLEARELLLSETSFNLASLTLDEIS